MLVKGIGMLINICSTTYVITKAAMTSSVEVVAVFCFN